MTRIEKILAGFASLIIIGVAIYNPCLVSYCSVSGLPEWLSKIVFSIPIPFGESIVLYFIALAPFLLITNSSEIILKVLSSIAASVTLIKYIKFFTHLDPIREMFVSLFSDFIFSLVLMSPILIFTAIAKSIVFVTSKAIKNEN